MSEIHRKNGLVLKAQISLRDNPKFYSFQLIDIVQLCTLIGYSSHLVLPCAAFAM